MSTQTQRVPGWLLPGGLGLLVVVLVAVALLRGPIELDPESPEGTVQEYLLAINEERWDDAIEIVHEGWRGSCTGRDIEAFSPSNFSAELGGDGRMGGRFVEEELVTVPGDKGESQTTSLPESTTSVEVTIHHGDQGGLGTGWNEFTIFELVEEDDFWWLTGDPWPHFVWSCRDQ